MGLRMARFHSGKNVAEFSVLVISSTNITRLDQDRGYQVGAGEFQGFSNGCKSWRCSSIIDFFQEWIKVTHFRQIEFELMNNFILYNNNIESLHVGCNN